MPPPRRAAALILLIVLTSGLGCRSAPDAASLVADAQQLERRGEANATHEAAAKYAAAVEAWRAEARPADAARTARTLGDTYFRLGLLRSAGDANRAAIAFARDAGDRTLQADASAAAGTISGM